ncbi:MAG: aldehyde dehydrogenase family protein [Desulfobacteraceae bacterium]|nr:MAG: aldehyde dehydrogenase family protein [Desulfobacteraceae bacterium]
MKNIKKLELSENYSVFSPADGQEVGNYPLMDRAAVDEAVQRARERFPFWADVPMTERRKILRKVASVLSENADYYAEIIARETGKTKLDALLADIYSTLDLLKYYSKKANKLLKPVRASGNPLLPGRKLYYRFEPKGVVGIIAPWNYPFTLLAGPAISALTAGNTVVLKPSSQTTESGLIFQEIMEKAGLPQGVIQVITGNGSVTGQALVENHDLDMIFFTGSTQVGKDINVQAAKRLIPTMMELGGKDVSIVTRNANLDRAAHGTLWGGITNSGQTCIGTELILVDRAVYDAFLTKIVPLAKNLKSGREAGQVGSMTMRSQFRIVEEQLKDALEKGASVLVGGKVDRDQKGLYFPPTILVDTTPDMLVRKEETFGPLLPVIPYDSLEEAVRMANQSEYGLSGSVFTTDMDEGRWVANRLKTGSVNINDVLVTYAYPSLPFGGVKKSGIGSYHGEIGLRAFTNVKSVTEFGWNLKRELFWYPVPEGGDKVAASLLAALFSGNPLRRLTSAVRAGIQVIQIAWSRRKQ